MTGATTGRVVTALDLPAASPGGSVELLYDLYTGHAPLIDAQVFMLPPATADAVVPAPIQLLPATGKCLDGPSFLTYVTRLRDQLAERVDARQIATVHLQHLTFGATPALIRLLPDHPHLALVHGTDLLFAATHRTQHRVLHETVRACRAIVVPTTAMADHLLHLTPHARHARIEHIPWGVPDSLLAAVLFAGELPAQIGGEGLQLIEGGASHGGAGPRVEGGVQVRGAAWPLVEDLVTQPLGPCMRGELLDRLRGGAALGRRSLAEWRLGRQAVSSRFLGDGRGLVPAGCQRGAQGVEHGAQLWGEMSGLEGLVPDGAYPLGGSGG